MAIPAQAYQPFLSVMSFAYSEPGNSPITKQAVKRHEASLHQSRPTASGRKNTLTRSPPGAPGHGPDQAASHTYIFILRWSYSSSQIRESVTASDARATKSSTCSSPNTDFVQLPRNRSVMPSGSMRSA